MPAAVREAIGDPRNHLTISAVSFWELSIKRATGKLDWPDHRFDALHASRAHKLAITPAHGIAAGDLPRHHDDPFDRLLIAQARAEGLTLVGGDAVFARYDVDVLWD